MKKSILIFTCMAMLVLSILPVINLKLGTDKKGHKWWSKAVLYNFDFALPYISSFFYPFGISLYPNQAIIGKDDWLYLGDGDQYQKTITDSRRRATEEDTKTARRIRVATKSWETWLSNKGVNMYKVMLAPNTISVYPEFLPDWIQPATESVTDNLLAIVNQEIYFDTRPALKAAKTQFSEPLYYKTDTHWNDLGAWVAFRAFTKSLVRTESELRLLSDQQVTISKVNERPGMGLANFLWMKDMLRDSEVIIKIATEHPIETEQYNYETGQLIASYVGNPKIDAPKHPLLVRSKHALNQKRVLWLRDSFGVALAPLMAATFTETLQLHYLFTNPALFSKLIDTFKPDFVFITVVERHARLKWFENLPPDLSTSGKTKNFISLSRGTLSKTNDLTEIGRATESYRISGADPFIAFALQNPVLAQDTTQLVFKLSCGENKGLVKVQVFWHTAGTSFIRNNSVHVATYPGITAIDLSSLSSWDKAGAITDLRIDLDPPITCPVLSIDSLALGKMTGH